MDTDGEVTDGDRAGAPDVRLESITTVLGDEPVLHRLRLTLPPGEITVLMGPSGAGKSTLVRHVAGLLPPDRGTVCIGGQDVWAGNEVELRAIRRDLSVMLGGSSLFDVSLFGSLTALENLTYGLTAHGVTERESRNRAEVQLRELHLDEVAEMLPEALPARARKRLALARALVIDAPLVILDEVDSAIDAAHGRRILRALLENHARTSCTMLIATHDIDLARALGGSLAILCNGRIVAHGSAAELLDGVTTSEEFEHRFRLSDFMGPLRMDDLGSDGDDSDRYRSMDLQTIWIGVMGLILVAVLVALTTVGAPLP